MRVLVVTNLYPSPRHPTGGTFVEQQVKGLRQIGLEVKVLFVDRVGKGMGAYWGLAKTLQETKRSFKPDITHVMYGGVMAEVVTRVAANHPTIISFCGTDLLGGSFFKFFRWLTVRYGVLASHMAGKRANAVVVKSRNLIAALPKFIDLNKVWIIPNGIDLERFCPIDRDSTRQKLGWQRGRYHVLVPGSPGHLRKRHELAQAAVEQLRCDGMAVELHFLHGVPHAEVPAWLNASDVLLLTSIHEGSPNIVKEALACNRTVVSTDVGDVRERIEDIHGCYLVSPESDDIAEKLRLALRSTSLVEGRKTVQDMSLERVAQRLKEVYVTVLESERVPDQSSDSRGTHSSFHGSHSLHNVGRGP